MFFCFINKQKLLPILATCARRLPRIFVSYVSCTIETTSDYFMFQINRHLDDTNVKYWGDHWSRWKTSCLVWMKNSWSDIKNEHERAHRVILLTRSPFLRTMRKIQVLRVKFHMEGSHELKNVSGEDNVQKLNSWSDIEWKNVWPVQKTSGLISDSSH